MKQIPLTQGKFTLVNDDDFEWLSAFKWHVSAHGYAVRSNPSHKNKKIWMHREINKTPKNLQTDHIDGNKLNNQRNNLRDATCAQNNMNRKKSDNCSSKYRGVAFNKKQKKWSAQLKVAQKCIWIGTFDSEIEAAKAYNKSAEKHFGEFTILNKIGENS